MRQEASVRLKQLLSKVAGRHIGYLLVGPHAAVPNKHREERQLTSDSNSGSVIGTTRVRSRCGTVAALTATLGLLVAVPAAGQPSGMVQGTVVDEGGGAPLPAAVVTIEELARSATTGSDGAFSFSDVPAGDYSLTVRRQGFAPLTSRITVAAGSPVRLDLSTT